MSHKPKSPPEEILPDFDARGPGYSREKWMEEYRRLNAPREEWSKAALARREKKPAKTTRKAKTWTPRYLTDAERAAVTEHVAAKFKALARRMMRIERGIDFVDVIDEHGDIVEKRITGLPLAVTYVQPRGFQVRLELDHDSEEELRARLIKAGADVDDVEDAVEKYAGFRSHVRDERRGINGIMREWAPWFFEEMSGEKIFEVMGRAMPESRRQVDRTTFPVRIAAEITMALIERYYADEDGTPYYPAGVKQIDNLLRKWRARPIAPDAPLAIRRKRSKYEGHYCPKCRTSPCACRAKS